MKDLAAMSIKEYLAYRRANPWKYVTTSCPNCGGRGAIKHCEPSEESRYWVDEWEEECRGCAGSGRVGCAGCEIERADTLVEGVPFCAVCAKEAAA